MAREINKSKLKNDIVLTVSLVFALLITRLIMKGTGLDMTKHDSIIFFVSILAFTKFLYHVLNKSVSWFFRVFLVGLREKKLNRGTE